MAQQTPGARPSMRVLLIVPGAGRLRPDGEGREDKFVEVASAWDTERGGLRFQLDVLPARMLAGESVTFVLTPADREAAPSDRKPAGRR